MSSSDAPYRRQFVRTALATAASYGKILGANDRIRIGAIGTGGRGQYLLSQLKLAEQNEIVVGGNLGNDRSSERTLGIERALSAAP